MYEKNIDNEIHNIIFSTDVKINLVSLFNLNLPYTFIVKSLKI